MTIETKVTRNPKFLHRKRTVRFVLISKLVFKSKVQLGKSLNLKFTSVYLHSKGKKKSLKSSCTCTGYSFSEALNLSSINPKYDDRFVLRFTQMYTNCFGIKG